MDTDRAPTNPGSEEVVPAETAGTIPAPTSLLTTQEVASLLRTSASTVRYWRHRGYGPQGIRTGRRVLYRASDVDAWLDQRASDEGS